MSDTPLKFLWFLPTYGDSRYIVGGGHGLPAGVAGGARPATLDYLGQIARSAEQLGYVGALTPTGAWCEDAFIVDAMLASVTEHFKFLIAIRPGLISPTLAAQMAATFQRYSDGRLLLNVVVGGEPHEQRAYADFSAKTERYERADEFLDLASYRNVQRWAKAIDARPAVKRGRIVNRLSGDPSEQLHERHDASDFETRTQDKLAARG